MRIILADHHVQACWVLKTLLEEESEWDLVGEAANAQDLICMAEMKNPDLILMDRELPGDTIEHLIATLQAVKPRPIIIVMSSEIRASRLILRAGADVFMSKVDDPTWLVEELRTYARLDRKENRSKNHQSHD